MTPEIAQLDEDWPLGRMIPLTRSSTVVAAGMYVGRAAELLHELYQPRAVFGFDPQLWALHRSAERAHRLSIPAILTARDPRGFVDYRSLRQAAEFDTSNKSIWHLFNFAIGTESDHGKTLPMFEWETDGCSFVTDTRVQGEGTIYEIGGVLNAIALPEIIDPGTRDEPPAYGPAAFDLALFNMEGYEYPLIRHMADYDLFSWFESMAIQFHTQHGNAIEQDDVYQIMTLAGFTLCYDDFPRWCYWARPEWLTRNFNDAQRNSLRAIESMAGKILADGR